MKKWLVGLVLFTSLFSIVRPAFAFPVTVNHAQGTTVIERVPQRVAVFDLATLDTMSALGVRAAGVPGTVMPTYLDQYADDSYVKIGSLFEPDYDALKSLNPDLIIVAGRSARAYEALSQLAPTLDLTIDPAHFVDGVKHNLALLGDIFNQQQKAQQLNTELNSKLSALRSQASEQGSALVLFTVNGHVIAHAPGERFGMLYELTGLTSVLSANPSSGSKGRPKPGSEEAKKQQRERQKRLDAALNDEPNWMFILDRGAATGGEGQAVETLSAMDKVTKTTAWKAEHVYYLDPKAWYLATGGYQSVSKTLDDLSSRFSE